MSENLKRAGEEPEIKDDIDVNFEDVDLEILRSKRSLLSPRTEMHK